MDKPLDINNIDEFHDFVLYKWGSPISDIIQTHEITKKTEKFLLNKLPYSEKLDNHIIKVEHNFGTGYFYKQL